MANSKQPHWPGLAFPLDAVTVRKTRNGRVAHLFQDYTNGAISGHAMSFCRIIQWPDSKNRWTNWSVAPADLPLCNHCGRVFHRERKNWRGSP